MGGARLQLLPGLGEDDGSTRTGRVRIVDGALRCIARQGVAKTTIDDVAREAGCSRATVYRVFAGGKDQVLAAVVETEVSRLFSDLGVAMGEASDVEEVLVRGMTEAAQRIGRNVALAFMLENEPEIVLPQLAFDHMDEVLSLSSAFAAPFLGRWLDHDEALRVAEWATRIVLSYIACPAEGVELTDTRSVRKLVRTFVLPGVRGIRPTAAEAAPKTSPPAEISRSTKPSTRPVTTAKGEAS